MSMEKNLTDAQSNVLKFIKERLASTGLPPTFREIQHHFGFKAIGSVQDHVRALKKKGAIRDDLPQGQRQSARSILPSDHRPEEVKSVPIYGEIAAGSTRSSEQIELGKLSIASHFAKDPCFALRVVGNSMIEAGIYEGDVLIVEREARVRPGDIVVALVDGETTVKRYVEKNGAPWLFPENPKMKPIPVSGRDFKVQGKVVGLQRKIG